MKEILEIADGLRRDNVPEAIVKEAIELICITEVGVVIKEFNEYEIVAQNSPPRVFK